MKRCYPTLRTLTIYWALVTLLVLSACTGTGLSEAPPTIKIALVAPFEGLHRPLGYEALFAVKLALQERNTAGGVNGYQIELVALNDFDDPTEARTQAGALVADPEVLGVVGHLSSEPTLAALPVYRQANLAVSIPWTTRPLDQQSGVVSVAATTVETAKRLETLIHEQGFNRITTVTDRRFGTISTGTQAIVLATEAVAAGEIALTLREDGMTQPLLGYVDVGSPQLVQVGRQATAGVVFVSPGPDPANIKEAAGFVEAYQAMAGFPPGPRAVLAYDATHVLLDAIAQAFGGQGRQPTRAEVGEVINNIERQGLSGKIMFDTRGQRVNAPIWVYQISEEGRYPGVLVTSEEE